MPNLYFVISLPLESTVGKMMDEATVTINNVSVRAIRKILLLSLKTCTIEWPFINFFVLCISMNMQMKEPI